MAIVKTYKLEKPEDGDKGSTFFDNLESNIDDLDAHDHTGSTGSVYTGKRLTTNAFNNTNDNIGTITTAVAGKDLYYKTITMPSGLTLSIASPTSQIRGIFFVDQSYKQYALTWERVTDTTYNVYCNDNTIDFTAIYV